jgi:hypothetical protein
LRSLFLGRLSFGVGYLSFHVDLLTASGSLPARCRLFITMSMLAFLLFSVAFAFVGTLLAVVCQLVALGGGLIPFLRDPVSLVGAPLSSLQLIFAPRNRTVLTVGVG